jgi:hypothetical protein
MMNFWAMKVQLAFVANQSATVRHGVDVVLALLTLLGSWRIHAGQSAARCECELCCAGCVEPA